MSGRSVSTACPSSSSCSAFQWHGDLCLRGDDFTVPRGEVVRLSLLPSTYGTESPTVHLLRLQFPPLTSPVLGGYSEWGGKSQSCPRGILGVGVVCPDSRSLCGRHRGLSLTNFFVGLEPDFLCRLVPSPKDRYSSIWCPSGCPVAHSQRRLTLGRFRLSKISYYLKEKKLSSLCF